jgi:glycine/D-amino acid oxidase-like deaminating enzyme
MKSFDVAIVGAGIVGAACAAVLSHEGLSVIVIERGGVATGTTATGMGHIVVMDDSEAQFALTRYSQQLWEHLAPEMPPACEYEHCGTIWVAANEDEMADVRRKHEFYASQGIATQILDEKALHDAEPNLAERLPGGLLVESDSVVYQVTATRHLIDKAAAAGAVARTGCRVTEIADDGVRLENGDTIAAAKIINAAGPWAGELTPELKIRRRKGHLIITDRYDGFVRHQLVELGYLRSAHGNYADSVAFNVQPRRTEQVLLGSSRQSDADESNVDDKILRKMTARALEYMPKLRELSAVRVWIGFRPATPDNLPYIGKIPGFENVYAAAGHEGLGITTSLGTAELLADEMMGRTPAISSEPYRPSRTLAEH